MFQHETAENCTVEQLEGGRSFVSRAELSSLHLAKYKCHWHTPLNASENSQFERPVVQVRRETNCNDRRSVVEIQ